MTEELRAANLLRWTESADGLMPPQFEGDQTARREILAQLYEANHCRFSAGLCENPAHGPDTIYLIIERGFPSEPGYERSEFHLRPDEAQTVSHVLSAAVWSHLMQRLVSGEDPE